MAEENGLPAVLIARTVEGAEVPVFRGDDAYGTGLATNHLISLGHKRIAMIGGTDQTSTGRDRYQGYVAAMETAGLEVKPCLAHSRAAHQAGRLRGGRAVPGAAGPPHRRLLLERPRRDRPDERHRARRPRAGRRHFRHRLRRSGRGCDRHAGAHHRLERPARGRSPRGAGAARQARRPVGAASQELIKPELHVRQSTGQPVRALTSTRLRAEPRMTISHPRRRDPRAGQMHAQRMARIGETSGWCASRAGDPALVDARDGEQRARHRAMSAASTPRSSTPAGPRNHRQFRRRLRCGRRPPCRARAASWSPTRRTC